MTTKETWKEFTERVKPKKRVADYFVKTQSYIIPGFPEKDKDIYVRATWEIGTEPKGAVMMTGE